MNPIHKKATECGISTSNREENEDLFRKIVEGKQAERRLVEGNMAYVVSRVDAFIDEFPRYEYLRDDLISEGFLTLCKIAEHIGKVGQVEDANPQGMLSVSLRNNFLDLVRKEREVPLTENNDQQVGYEPANLTDLKLDILSCCKDDTDRKIVELRCQGLLDQQIADRLSLTSRRICQRRTALFERFQETQ